MVLLVIHMELLELGNSWACFHRGKIARQFVQRSPCAPALRAVEQRDSRTKTSKVRPRTENVQESTNPKTPYAPPRQFGVDLT